jgi:hypothetical protein
VKYVVASGEKSERGVAIVGSVKKIVCNDRLTAVKLNAEEVNVLIVQVYMPTSDYEDGEVEELYDSLEVILEEDGNGDTNTITMTGKLLSAINQTVIFVAHMDWEIKTKEVKCLLTFVKELDSLSLTRGLRSLREGCITGKLQVINIDISWIMYL